MIIRNNNAISIAIAVAITAATVTGLMANAESTYNHSKTHALVSSPTLQRLPTIVVMSEPEYQRLDAVVVTANPADYAYAPDTAVVSNDWTAPARTVTTQLIRNAAFDMPYYSFGTTKTLVAKE